MKGSAFGFDFETASELSGGGGGTEDFIERCFVSWHFGLDDPFVVDVVENDRWLVETNFSRIKERIAGALLAVVFIRNSTSVIYE
jgi:hypothetical protein